MRLGGLPAGFRLACRLGGVLYLEGGLRKLVADASRELVEEALREELLLAEAL